MFWVSLIKIISRLSARQKEILKVNCTHVEGPFYIFEGDTYALEDEGIELVVVAEGSVGALGGLRKKELKDVCKVNLGKDIDELMKRGTE